MGWSYRAATTNAGSLPANWEELGRTMAGRLAMAVRVFDIHPSMVANMDQSYLALIPISNERTYAMRGARHIGITGRDDKRAITIVRSFAADGHLLPMQVIFKGKTERSLPLRSVAAGTVMAYGWHITCTRNHWASLRTVSDWVKYILEPYYKERCKKLNKPEGKATKLVLLLDCWSVHRSQEFRDWVRAEYTWLLLLYVPACCTSKLQPADVIVQRPLKAGIV